MGALTALILIAAAGFVAWPLPEDLLAREEISSLRFLDREGRLLRELRSRADGRSVPLEGGEIPPLVRKAFVAAEDRRFDDHPGVDPLAIARAARQNLQAGRIVSGASTITQQLARMIRVQPEGRVSRTFSGKVREALWALRLEVWLSKDRILLEYLDRVPLGNSTYGVEAAAQLYFGRPAARLSVGQAAVLAGMARSPARLDPYRRRDAAEAGKRSVLGRMVALGHLGEEAADRGGRAPLDLVEPARVFLAPHLLVALEKQLPSLGLNRAVRVETTLDPSLQADVEAMMREELAALSENRVGQAAVVVVDNTTGEILAYAGSVDFLDEEHQGQNDGVRALRQPGSALKPFVYGLALEDGMTAATVLSDVEVHLATPSGAYVPRNYDRRSHGPVRLRAALASSFNVPAVRVADQVGTERAVGVLRAAGFHSLQEDPSHYGVGVVLGNGDVSLRELARAFRGLALGGELQPLREIRGAWDAAGNRLPIPAEVEGRRFLEKDVAALLTDILSDERERSPGFGLDNALRLPFPVAAKTGTSRAYVDNWTVGYTRERTVAVWVGNFDGSSMRGVSGITGAGPLFRRVMIRAMRGIHPAPLVDRGGFETAEICPLSGALAGPACEGAVHEVFLPGTVPGERCPMHRLIPADSVEEGEGRMVRALDVGPGFYGWARAEGWEAGPLAAAPKPASFPGGGELAPGSLDERLPGQGADELPPSHGRRAASEERHAPADDLGRAEAASAPLLAQILLPSDGDEYLIDPGIPLDAQAIPIRIVAPAGGGALELRLEGGEVIPLPPPYTARLMPRRGSQQVELWAQGGAAPLAISRFVVR